jgi:hypothetical protein
MQYITKNIFFFFQNSIMNIRSLDEIIPLSQLIFLIGKNHLRFKKEKFWKLKNSKYLSWIGERKINLYQATDHSLSPWYIQNFIKSDLPPTFTFIFTSGISIYIQTAEPTDFQNVSGISFLESDFTVNETNFATIPENSLVVLDDFAFRQANNKQAKLNFQKVVNYILRHKKITLVLIIHNLFSNNLSTEILYATHLFLSYSNLGYLIMRWDYF